MPDTTHPTDSIIEAFSLGKLRPAETLPVEEHLADCDQCQERAERVAPDTLVSLLASTRTRFVSVRTDAPTPTFATAATPSYGHTHAWTDHAAETDEANIPAALAGHPRYRVLRRLGTGGMGTVWLAEHTVMNRPVAVKVIRPELLSRPGAATRFLREVRAAAKLHHPNIVTAFDAEAVGDSCLLVMEYVPGETLADRVKDRPLPVEEACRAVRDAARGLAHAHAAGLVHRDVKPHNLIRAADGTVKVLDFGLAGVGAGEVVAAAGEGLTGTGMVCGTPDYIAPEQVADPHAADARADIYGLGCTFYHLLAGRPPFPEGNIAEKLAAQQARTPEPIPGLPPALGAILAIMLEKRPQDRYQSASEVVAALDAVCESWRAGGVSPPKPRRRWLAIATGLLFAGLLVAAGVVFKVYRDNQEITITTDDPDIEVVMKRKGEVLRVIDKQTGQVWEIDTTTNEIAQADQANGLSLHLPAGEAVILRRKGKEVFTVTRAPRPVAPPTTGGEAPRPASTIMPRLVREIDNGGEVRALEFGPDARTLISAGNDLRVFDLSNGNQLHREPRPGYGTDAISVSADGRIVAAASRGGVVLVFDAAERKRVKELAVEPKSSFPSVALSPDGLTLAYSSTSKGDEAIHFYEVATGRADTVPIAPYKGSVSGLRFASDGRHLVYTVGDVLTVLNVNTRKVTDRKFIGSTADAIDITRDGKTVAVLCGRDGNTAFYVLALNDGVLQQLHYQTDVPLGTRSLAVSPDGKYLALGLRTGTVEVWDLAQKRLAASWAPGDFRRSLIFLHATLAFAPDGKTLLTGGASKIKVWDLVEVPGKPDRELLEGGWMAVSGEYDGDKKFTADELKSTAVEFYNVGMALDMRGRKYLGTVTLDPTQNPKHITVIAGASENYRSMTGVYKLEGDYLTICMGEAKDGRPTEFRSKAGTTILNVVLKRVSGAALPGSPKGTFALPHKANDGGNWSVTLDGVGKFRFNRNGELAVEGTYTISGNKITFTDEAGPHSQKREKRAGAYRWKLTGWLLTFEHPEDENLPRLSLLTSGGWMMTPDSIAPRPFAWPADDLREGRIPAPDLSKIKPRFSDDFSDPKSGWFHGRSAPGKDGWTLETGYDNGKYYALYPTAGGSAGRASPWGKQSNFAVEVAGRLASPSAKYWSLAFTTEDGKRDCHVHIRSDGKLDVAFGGSDWPNERLFEALTHTAIKNPAEFNRLLVVVREKRVEVYVNGVAVCDPIALPRPVTPTMIGLGGGGEKGARVEFDSITLWPADELPTPEQRVQK